MRIKAILEPRIGPLRLFVGRDEAIVVALLACLFAAALLAALGTHPLVDVGQAAMQGGL